MSATENHSLEVVRTFNASPSEVFKAFTDSEILSQWMGPGEIKCQSAESDARKDGEFRLEMVSPDGEVYIVGGKYMEFIPGEKLRYSWSWETSDTKNTMVTISFKEVSEGTEVVLVHENFSNQEAANDHSGGWAGCLNKLTIMLGGKPEDCPEGTATCSASNV